MWQKGVQKMSAYTNQEKVEAYLDRDLTANEETLLDGVIAYISNVINGYTNRIWNDIDGDAPEASEKIYDGNGKREVFVDDFTELTSVDLLDSNGDSYQTLSDVSEFINYPLNSGVYESIHLRNYRIGNGAGRIKVTAVFTSGEAPDDIVMVATALVAKFMARRSVNAGAFKKESIEGYSYEVMNGKDADEETKALLMSLDSWRKITI